jgi:hypothetical protein
MKATATPKRFSAIESRGISARVPPERKAAIAENWKIC